MSPRWSKKLHRRQLTAIDSTPFLLFITRGSQFTRHKMFFQFRCWLLFLAMRSQPSKTPDISCIITLWGLLTDGFLLWLPYRGSPCWISADSTFRCDSRRLKLTENKLYFSGKHSAMLQLLREDYLFTYQPLYVARNSFIQLSELIAQASIKQQEDLKLDSLDWETNVLTTTPSCPTTWMELHQLNDSSITVTLPTKPLSRDWLSNL